MELHQFQFDFKRNILEGWKGITEYKLNCMGEVIYKYGWKDMEFVQTGGKEERGQAKSRRQDEIQRVQGLPGHILRILSCA